MHERRCFLLSKQLGGDVLEILFSAAVSLTTGISTFRARIVRLNVYRGRTAKTETGHVYVVSPRLNIPRRCTFPSTRFRVNPCPTPNIYKEFYWNALRLASHLRQSCYPSNPRPHPGATSFVFSCWYVRFAACSFRFLFAKSSFHFG